MVVVQRETFSHHFSKNIAIPLNCVQHLKLLFCEKAEIFKLNLQHFIAEFLLEICEDCAKMAALPHGAFAACKLRENFRDRDLIIARMKANDTKNNTENKKLMEYSPVKYNDKLMNSIWGIYNRYSPHNIKSNDYELGKDNYYMQQHIAVASHAIAENLATTMASGNEWRFMEK